MRAWGQPPLFRIRPGEEALDARLAARGYVVRDPTLILAAPAAAIAVPPGEAAVFGSGPLACMAEIWAAGGIGPARLAVMARVAGAARLPPRPPRRPPGRRRLRRARTAASPCCTPSRSPPSPAATASAPA